MMGFDSAIPYVHRQMSKVFSEADMAPGVGEILIRQRCMSASYSFAWGAFLHLFHVSSFVRISHVTSSFGPQKWRYLPRIQRHPCFDNESPAQHSPPDWMFVLAALR